jgi:hypothetical protein
MVQVLIWPEFVQLTMEIKKRERRSQYLDTRPDLGDEMCVGSTTWMTLVSRIQIIESRWSGVERNSP